MDDAAIWMTDLRCGYGDRIVLDVEELGIRRGRITGILGPSGCGKSTLIRNLLLLDRPKAGSVLVDGEEILGEDPAPAERFRRRSGVLFQGAALFQSLTVAQNVSFPLLERGGASEEVADEVARRKLATVGLAHAADLKPAQLSGGMRKRAGVARALAGDPDFLFLDEPSAGLDPSTAAGMDRLILDVRERFGSTIVVVTHELASLHTIADDLVMLFEGSVLASGPREEVQASSHPAVRAFFDRTPPHAAAPESTFRARMDAARPRP